MRRTDPQERERKGLLRQMGYWNDGGASVWLLGSRPVPLQASQAGRGHRMPVIQEVSPLPLPHTRGEGNGRAEEGCLAQSWVQPGLGTLPGVPNTMPTKGPSWARGGPGGAGAVPTSFTVLAWA